MKILTLETSAKSVSCAVVEDGAPLASAYQCTGLTHSRTLLPMVDAMLKNADLTLDDINAIAIAAGPGSFTGLRIGTAAVKGLAFPRETLCAPVSTLEALAAAHTGEGTVLCALDARRAQVYSAAFELSTHRRLLEDDARAVADLAEFVENKAGLNTIVDFCCGNGAVPLILSTRVNSKIIGFELQKNVFQLAYNSVILNNLEKKVKIINANLNECLEYILPESVDAVTCNPPYFKLNKGSYINTEESLAIARHEIKTNIEEIVMTAKYILKNKAPLYLVHRPERLMPEENYKLRTLKSTPA